MIGGNGPGPVDACQIADRITVLLNHFGPLIPLTVNLKYIDVKNSIRT
jgi:hypothetical protein